MRRSAVDIESSRIASMKPLKLVPEVSYSI